MVRQMLSIVPSSKPTTTMVASTEARMKRMVHEAAAGHAGGVKRVQRVQRMPL
jgi:hypothetical protein